MVQVVWVRILQNIDTDCDQMICEAAEFGGNKWVLAFGKFNQAFRGRGGDNELAVQMQGMLLLSSQESIESRDCTSKFQPCSSNICSSNNNPSACKTITAFSKCQLINASLIRPVSGMSCYSRLSLWVKPLFEHVLGNQSESALDWCPSVLILTCELLTGT